MNYRHIYYAGNFADVFKHCILILLTQSLLRKDKSVFYLDTHAGIGCYDLESGNAKKTREYENGIWRLYNLQDSSSYPDVVNTYLQIVRSFDGSKQGTQNGSSYPRFYPGSPYFVRSLLRAQDSMALVEMHPEDALTLKKEFYRDKRVAVHHMNGYQSTKAFLPPKDGRGLIFIDPPYEEKDEFQNIIIAIQIALKHFSAGIYAIWYPIKDLVMIKSFYADLKQLDAKNILIAELSLVDSGADLNNGLNSCGMAIINAPWKFEEELKPVLSCLSQVLAVNSGANSDVRWLLRQDA